jgi:hypothetical protein
MTNFKRTPILAALAIMAAALLVLFSPGCGSNDTTTTEEPSALDNGDQTSSVDEGTSTSTSDTGGSDLNTELSDLENLEATVEVKSNGETVVIWSQKKGSWRWEDPNDSTSYVIYNKDQDKLWVVNGDVAAESTGVGAEGQAWWGMSPAAMISTFSAFPGAMNGDTLEINAPGGGSVKIEFKGPQGLPSKMTTEDASTNETEVIEFIYTNVGSVPSDMFELPANVTIQSMPDMQDLPNMDNLDTAVPGMPNNM